MTEGSTALLTDRYELTMADAAVHSGVAGRRAVFEVFARRLPPGRRYGVVAGLGRLVEAIEAFRFGSEELEALSAAGILDAEGMARLTGYTFCGSIDAYAEGELYYPYSPVLTVEATFGEAIMLETLVLSILNHDSAVASAAARMVAAAGQRSVWEMGSRRTHEQAAVAAARSAWIAGFAGTSNLEAGRHYGIPTSGTVAHAFIMAHPDERAAFGALVAAMGPGTTLLVDTYDIIQGIRSAVEVAGPHLGAIRIDSGDLAAEARRARAQLDALGARHTRILVSGDLDEYAIEELAGRPIDAYGVGTSLVAGSGAPTADFIYKLVAIADRPDGAHQAPLRSVAKQSEAKATPGGRKDAWRIIGPDGIAIQERVVARPATGSISGAAGSVSGAASHQRGLQVPVMRHGHRVYRTTLQEVRAHHRAALAELAPLSLMTVAGPPVLDATPTVADPTGSKPDRISEHNR